MKHFSSKRHGFTNNKNFQETPEPKVLGSAPAKSHPSNEKLGKRPKTSDFGTFGASFLGKLKNVNTPTTPSKNQENLKIIKNR